MDRENKGGQLDLGDNYFESYFITWQSEFIPFTLM